MDRQLTKSGFKGTHYTIVIKSKMDYKFPYGSLFKRYKYHLEALLRMKLTLAVVGATAAAVPPQATPEGYAICYHLLSIFLRNAKIPDGRFPVE